MSWMAWTPPTIVFFAVIAMMLTVMTVWEALRPCVPRRGLLPMATTRGDRLFIGLLTAAYFNLAWLGFTEISQWYALAVSAVLLAVIGRFG